MQAVSPPQTHGKFKEAGGHGIGSEEPADIFL
jgi:hypothetical protein